MKISPLKCLLAIGLVLVITEPLYPAKNDQPASAAVVPQAQQSLHQQPAFSPQPGTYLYTIQNGETLSKIASMFMPYTSAYTKKELMNTIKTLNGITGALSPGQTIKIPIAWSQPLKPRTVPKPKTFVAKGIYINTSNAGTRFILDSAEKLKQCGGNTIVFDAKDDLGAITFRSDIPKKYCPKENYTPNIEDLPKMIELLHRMDMHVIARVVVFRDTIMARTRPDWVYTKQFLNPAIPEVQEYMLTVIREIANTGVDEIQLDYIRYFADSEKNTGVEGKTRNDIITGFVKRVHDITSSKGILLSMDMFGIVIWQRPIDVTVVGQDVKMLSPYVDIISPMLYPSHFEKGFSGISNPADEPYMFVYDGISMMKELVGDSVIVRPWLQAFPMGITKGFGPWYMESQIKATLDSCGTGWLFWSPQNKYTYSYAAMEIVQNKKYSTPDCKAFIARLKEKKAAQTAAKEQAVQEKNGSQKKKPNNGKPVAEAAPSAKTAGGI
ncbi:MAG TPA: putative glycoside hydrolase [Desulfomonilia bacterium]